MPDFHIKADRISKEEQHEKESIEYAHGAGAVPDAPARPRMGGGSGRAGGRRHRAGGAAAGENSGCGIARHIRTGGGKWHCRSERRGQHREKRSGGGYHR